MEYVGLQPSAFLTDPAFVSMTAEQRGAYSSVIYWLYVQDGEIKLNGNGVAIATLIGSAKQPAKLWDSIKHKFEIDGDIVRHKRVTVELQKAQNRSKAAKEAGKRGAEKRWGGHRVAKGSPKGRHGKPIAKVNVNVNTRKEINKEKKIKCLDVVFLTEAEKKKLVERFGKAEAKAYVERLNNYIMSKGKKYKSHYHTILSWAAIDAKKGGKQLREIFGKSCSSCGMMPVFWKAVGDYGDHYYCKDHIPKPVKEKLRKDGYNV